MSDSCPCWLMQRLIFAGALLMPGASVTAEAPVNVNHLLSRARCERWEPVSPAELSRVHDLFCATLQSSNDRIDPTLAAAWRAVQMELVEAGTSERRLLVVSEAPERRIGRGFYVFAEGERALCVQAPHATADLDTGKILLRMIASPFVTTAVWSTAPRSVVDPSHVEGTYFQALTRAYAKVHPQALLVQLHGFDATARNPPAAVLDIIVSSGGKTASVHAETLTACLAQNAGIAAALYGSDVNELGGATSVQGKALRRLGHGGFLHLEISRDQRKKLLRDKPLREIWLACFAEAAADRAS